MTRERVQTAWEAKATTGLQECVIASHLEPEFKSQQAQIMTGHGHAFTLCTVTMVSTLDAGHHRSHRNVHVVPVAVLGGSLESLGPRGSWLWRAVQE